MKTLEKITNIHFDHSLWFNEIRFYLDEIPIFRSRIAAMEKESSKETGKKLEKFSARFKEQEKTLKKIFNHIKKHELHIYNLTHMNGSLVSISNREHEDIHDQILAFRVQNELLKKEFNDFINS